MNNFFNVENLAEAGDKQIATLELTIVLAGLGLVMLLVLTKVVLPALIEDAPEMDL